MKNLLIFFTLLALPSLTLAQSDFRPGYIVNLQGDTLKGQVNYKGDLKNALECNFRVNETAEARMYKPTELKGYGFTGGKFYEPKKAKIVNRQLNLANQFDEVPVAGNDSINFMQVLVKGTASLYYLRDATSATHYYFQMSDKPVEELIYLKATMVNKNGSRYFYESKQYIGILKIALKDCPAITEKLDRTDFKPSALQNLISDYNYCIEPNTKVVALGKPKTKITWGILAGLSFSKLNISIEDHYLAAGNYQSEPAFNAGIYCAIPMISANDKLSLHNALYLTKRNYTANFNYQNSDLYNSDYQVNLKFQYLRLESTVRYTAPSKGIKPFGQAGIAINYMLSNEETIFSTKYYLDYPGKDDREPDYLSSAIRKYQLGMVGGAGIKYDFPNRNSISLQLNYEYNTGFTKGVGISTNSHNTAILVGFGF